MRKVPRTRLTLAVWRPPSFLEPRESPARLLLVRNFPAARVKMPGLGGGGRKTLAARRTEVGRLFVG